MTTLVKILRALRTPAALSVCATLSNSGVFAQDCWLPDALEPNDTTPVPIASGLYSGLALHQAGVNSAFDMDRFAITIPPFQRLTLDFTIGALPPGADPNTYLRIFGDITEVNSPGEVHGFEHASTQLHRQPVYDNPTAQPLDVVALVRSDQGGHVGCFRYDMNVSFGPRPCDLLADDAWEGPDDCISSTTLQDGFFDDLVVFNDLRIAGEDADFYRVLNVADGDGFQVDVLPAWGNQSAITLSVYSTSGCTGPRSDGRSQFVLNDSGVARDYFLKLETSSSEGFERYDLQLQYDPCGSIAADALEPNAACGPFAGLTAGSHTGLSLSQGDVDGFEVSVPPEFHLRVIVASDASRHSIVVGGAEAPNCPPQGASSFYAWNNNTAQVATHRLRVEAPQGGCGTYSIQVELTPLRCSGADLAQNEPNDDCSSATPLNLSAPQPNNFDLGSVQFALNGQDVDVFTVDVPSGTVYEAIIRRNGYSSMQDEFEAGVEVLAYAGGNCSTVPLRAAAPAIEPFSQGPTSGEATRILLPNFGAGTLQYAIRVSATSVLTDCESYTMRFTGRPVADVYPPSSGDNGTCAGATTIGDSGYMHGILAPGHPIHGGVALPPGETLTAWFTLNPAWQGVSNPYEPMRLEFFDGVSACEAAGVPMAGVDFVPRTVFGNPMLSDLVRLSHTNTTSDVQRIVIRCALGDQVSLVTEQRVYVRINPPESYAVFCSSKLPAATPLPCPCGNESTGGAHAVGCENSTGFGARLSGTGSNSVQVDNFYVTVDNLPASALGVLLYMNPVSGGSGQHTFFDGQLCVGPSVLSAWNFSADNAGSWTSPAPLASSMSTPLGRRFQVWYRDSSGPCGTGSNTTNGILIEWQP